MEDTDYKAGIYGEVMQLAWGYTASNLQSWDLNPDKLVLEAMFIIMYPLPLHQELVQVSQIASFLSSHLWILQ